MVVFDGSRFVFRVDPDGSKQLREWHGVVEELEVVPSESEFVTLGIESCSFHPPMQSSIYSTAWLLAFRLC